MKGISDNFAMSSFLDQVPVHVSERDNLPGQLHEEDLQLHQRGRDAASVWDLRGG